MNSALGSSDNSKAVLITGCSSGIGKATARRLAKVRERYGWTIWASARCGSSLSDLEAAGCRTLELDVDDGASMREAVRTIEGEHGAVSVLVNNAGYAQAGAIEAVPMQRIRKQFETNVFGLIELTQLVLPGMRAQRSGRIINLSSMGGKLTFPGAGCYHATKYAVEALSDALRFEVRGFGIHVVLIEPGMINSGFGDAIVGNMKLERDGMEAYEEFHASILRATKDLYENRFVARLAGTPDDVAAVIERAMTREKPRTRYTVTASAKLLLAHRRWLSDRAWDATMRSGFPSPGENIAKAVPTDVAQRRPAGK